MKTKIFICMAIAILSMTLKSTPTKAQIPVTDVANIAQGITNSVLEIAEASTTAVNVINTFNQAKEIYNQGKEYYDKLKSVHNLVKDAAKVQKTVLLVGDITDMYFTNFEKMLSDKNYSPQELGSIAAGYAKLLQESTDALKELKDVVNNSSGMSMTDKERMDVIDRSYNNVKHYRDLTAYYTRKNISVSYLRSQKAGNMDKIKQLYGNSNERYW